MTIKTQTRIIAYILVAVFCVTTLVSSIRRIDKICSKNLKNIDSEISDNSYKTSEVIQMNTIEPNDKLIIYDIKDHQRNPELSSDHMLNIDHDRTTEAIIEETIETSENEEVEENNEEVINNSENVGKFKSYMSYKAITLKSSKQYQLQQIAYTDENGFRRIDEYYMIATGSFYGKVGDVLKVTLSTGNSFYAVKGDAKADKDTDKENKVCTHDGSVVEFIVDTSSLISIVKRMGDASYMEGFEGYVTSIEVVEENAF